MLVEVLSFLVQTAFVFVLPLLASVNTLKTQNLQEQKRWLIHWILVVILMTFVWPILGFLEGILGSFVGGVLNILVSLAVFYQTKFLKDTVEQKLSHGVTLSLEMTGVVRVKIQEQLKKHGFFTEEKPQQQQE